MARLRFGVWIPTYGWGDEAGGPENVRKIRESILKCEEHGLDIWVIDHLLSAPGLYGNAWLEPLTILSYAGALTSTVRLATGILVLPVRHPVMLAKEISTLCLLSGQRYLFGVGPGWYAREFEATGTRIEERGARTDEILDAVALLLSAPNATYRGRYYQFQDVTIDPRPPRLPEIWVSGGSRVPDPDEHDVPTLAKSVATRIVKAGHWLSRCSGTQEWIKRDWADEAGTPSMDLISTCTTSCDGVSHRDPYQSASIKDPVLKVHAQPWPLGNLDHPVVHLERLLQGLLVHVRRERGRIVRELEVGGVGNRCGEVQVRDHPHGISPGVLKRFHYYLPI